MDESVQMQLAVQDALRQMGNGQLSAVGGVAGMLMHNAMSVAALRTNDVLTKDEWIQYDRTVVQVARQRMGITQALLGRGLRYPLANALGTTVLQHSLGSDMDPADVNMSGVTEGIRDRLIFSLINLPIPIVHKDFQINIRNLESSRRGGQPLDTTTAAVAARIVVEGVENMIVNGASITSGGGTVQGLINATNRNTGSLAANWALVATTGAQIVGDVMEMIDQLQADNMYGPYMLIVPNNYSNKLNDDYKAESDRTIRERIMQLEGVEAIVSSSFMPANNVVLLQMTSDVIEIVDGMQPTTVMWDTHGGMMVNFKVMAIMVPRLRYDAKAQSGIAHHTV